LAGDERLRSEERAKETMYRRASAIQNSWKMANGRQVQRRRSMMQGPGRDRTPSRDRADYMFKKKGEFAFRGRGD
jgi:hypothetical protein